MTHPVSSSTESEALRIGDPSPPVIPHLMRDPYSLLVKGGQKQNVPRSQIWHSNITKNIGISNFKRVEHLPGTGRDGVTLHLN